jgi:outer membrane protein OmpA-like peptidoglycan-associated protein
MQKLVFRGLKMTVSGAQHARGVVAVSLFAALVMSAPAHAEGPFVGFALGASEPANNNYRAHVHEGATANPFVGYMWNRYLGAQGQLHFVYQEPDNDRRGFNRENQATTLFGGTIGPRLVLPLSDTLEFYMTGEAGFFSGLSGSMTHTGPGVSAGGGLDYLLTPNFAVGAFGRWNRAYTSPTPTTLSNLLPDQQGPADATWATGGISITYHFTRPAAAAPQVVAETPPPPPPAPVQPQPPVRRKIVLRGVHFDFDKATIRRDAVPVLDETVQTLKEEGTIAVIAEGHTDSDGTEAYNLDLSYRRAQAVGEYLVDHGIAPKRIRTEGFGESRPVASNDTADGRAQNRRVELRVE